MEIRRVRREGKRGDRLVQLFGRQTLGEGTKVQAPKLLRHVQPPQPGLSGLGEQTFLGLGREQFVSGQPLRVALEHHRFER